MLLGVIADDFTGASDIANTIVKGTPGVGGLATTQFLGCPEGSAPAGCEAGVIALKTRSIPAAAAVAQSLAALDWLRGQGCRQIVFKVCSTFDSTPAGNIGPVADALADALGARTVVVCPAFPTAGRTVYRGHLFVGDRPLNESGLEHHPLNPMTDADIRRWLARQTAAPVGLVAWPEVRKGAQAVASALEAAAGRGERLIIVDAIADDDLLTIAAACADARLLTGGSGIALGLPGNFIRRGLAAGRPPTIRGVGGPEVVLAGSCSPATRRQVELHAAAHPSLAVAVDAAVAGQVSVAEIVGFIVENTGRAPIVYSSAAPEEVAAAQARYGRAQVAEVLERLMAAVATAAVEAGIRRMVVAGGETSGAVVSALRLGALEIGPEIDPGVPALVAEGERRLGLVLKSGNFGSDDFFAKAILTLETL